MISVSSACSRPRPALDDGRRRVIPFHVARKGRVSSSELHLTKTISALPLREKDRDNAGVLNPQIFLDRISIDSLFVFYLKFVFV